MNALTNNQFLDHVNNTIDKILKFNDGQILDFCNNNPIQITFNGKTTIVNNNADTMECLVEILKESLKNNN